METSNSIRGLVLHRSLLRPILLAGAERRLVMINMTLIATLLLGVGLYPVTVISALLLATIGHWCLAQAAKADPMMTAIYLRHLRYDNVYLGCGQQGRSKNQFHSLPEQLFIQ
jgi:type IV secretory pathway TrbD component